MSTIRKINNVFGNLFFDIIGGGLCAVGTQVFNAPNNIAPGGVSGIAILLNYLFGWPISILTLLFNVPLLILAFFLLGKKFSLRTFITVLISIAMLSLANTYLPVYTGEKILAALFGGVLTGIGVALVFMRGSTTGGTDIIGRLIQKKFPNLAIGKILLLLDALVLIAAAVVYRNIESALFALVGIFARSQILDSILCGLDMGKVMLVVSSKYDELSVAINKTIGRGCTLLSARGSYTKQERPVIMCVVRNSQYYDLKKVVTEIDPDAFLIALEAGEIIGNGFKHYAVG